MNRRLAAILFADVVGFSQLMGEDEAGTLSILERLTSDTITPIIEQNRGRVVKLIGDGFLIEFASVVDALTCALDWQETISALANTAPGDVNLCFRIGINLGDVIVRGDDIYGDGVNVATRLQSITDPGTILVSRTVFNHAVGKLDADFEDLGETELKNIANPLQVFRVTRSSDSTPTQPIKKPRKASKYLAAILAMLLVALGSGLWLVARIDRGPVAKVQAMALPLPDKTSIAVLPFDDMSDDTSYEYFTDGMTEDLITELSKISDLFVIARHTMFTYKEKQFDIRDVAEDLGVRYILEGSVRRSGDKLRVNVHLIDATTGGHVWADKFDGELEDVFEVQDQFVFRIVDALALEISDGERNEIARSETGTIEAREAFQQGWDLYSCFNEQDSAKSVQFFEQAIELDLEYGRAYGALALVYQRDGIFRWNNDPTVPRNQTYVKFVRPNLNKAKQHDSSLVHVVEAIRHLNFRGQITGETGGQRTMV